MESAKLKAYVLRRIEELSAIQRKTESQWRELATCLALYGKQVKAINILLKLLDVKYSDKSLTLLLTILPPKHPLHNWLKDIFKEKYVSSLKKAQASEIYLHLHKKTETRTNPGAFNPIYGGANTMPADRTSLLSIKKKPRGIEE